MKHLLKAKDSRYEPQAKVIRYELNTDIERNDSKDKWAKLTLTTPKNDFVKNSTILITGADFKIGRAPTNDFVLADQRLSSLHARITQEFDEQG